MKFKTIFKIEAASEAKINCLKVFLNFNFNEAI